MVPPNDVIGKAVIMGGKPVAIPSVGWIFLWLKGDFLMSEFSL